jgi:hypothetical protein
MRSAEVRAHLDALALTATDAARLLGVGLRSVRRWTQPERASVVPPAACDPDGVSEGAQGEAIPGPAAQVLRAWLKLQRAGMHWRPDGLPLGDVDPAVAIARARERAAEHAGMHDGKRAGPGAGAGASQGAGPQAGPTAHWDVDLTRYVASMGGHRVSFVWPGQCAGTGPAAVTAPLGWALQSYCPPHVDGAGGGALSGEALAELIDDACVCIARRLAGEREPPLAELVLGEPVLVGQAGRAGLADQVGRGGPIGHLAHGTEAVELRDVSLNPIVVCRLSRAVLAAFLELPAGTEVTPAQLLAFARRHHAVLADLASEIHARPPREPSPTGLRVLDISVGDLGLVRRRLGTRPLVGSAEPNRAVASDRPADAQTRPGP